MYAVLAQIAESVHQSLSVGYRTPDVQIGVRRGVRPRDEKNVKGFGGKKAETVSDTFEEVIALPAKMKWKVGSEKEVVDFKNINIYTLLLATSVPSGHNIIGLGWVFRIKADHSKKGRIIVLRWRQVLGRDCLGAFAPVSRLQSIRMVLAIIVDYNLGCW